MRDQIKNINMFKRTGILKEFGPEGMKVTEEVARRSSFLEHSGLVDWKPDIFCLRIDADEYSEESFRAFYPLFEKYPDVFTIFFNVNSFRDASHEIIRCRDMGIDVQSHAFYHYTYSDYASNRYNIRKAKEFFESIGIKTKGFASPMGRWSGNLMKALEDEGYLYASEFSYDYTAFPSYPVIGVSKCSVLEIPVFPVAPELFFLEGKPDTEKVVGYYIDALDNMTASGIPAVIYAHTPPLMPDIPGILMNILDYALEKKGLSQSSMSDIYDIWQKKSNNEVSGTGEMDNTQNIMDERFMGKKVRSAAGYRIKDAVKNLVDFERVTPAEELRCGKTKKMLKLLSRKIL